MRKALFLLILVLATVPLSAQWRRGGLFGADVRALIVDPNSPDTYYLGTTGGEVYLSSDGAKTWRNAFNGTPFPGYVVDNLVIDRFGRLWAACWGLWGGGVVAVSDDHGKTWTRRDAGLEDFSVRAIAIDPRDADLVIVGGLTGVYRSTDAGATWTRISDQENVESVAIDPRTSDRIYVGTWRQGIRTDDGGATWKAINNGMVLDTDMFSILVHPDDPDNLWVSTCGWVYNTANRGENWTRYRDGFNNRRIHDIELDPCDRDTLYAGSVAGLYRSEDGGKTWYVVSDEGLVVNSIAMHPQRPDRIVLGIEGDGVYVSEDKARTFTRSSDGLYNMRITSITPDPVLKDRAYASVVSGGAASGIYRSDDGGSTWTMMSTTRLPEVLSLAIADEMDAETRFIAGTDKGFFWSTDGVEWTQAAPINAPVRVDKVLRFNRTRFFAATSDGVFTSRDSGKTWYRLAGSSSRTVDIAVGSIGLNRALFALTESGLMIYDGENWGLISDSPDRGHTLAVRKINGSQFVFVAGAQGVHAGRVDVDRVWYPAEAPDAQYASVFGAMRSSEQMLFLTSRSQRDILMADASGPDWKTIVLPSRNAEVTTVAPDPFQRTRFYIGTQGDGVWVYEGPPQKYVAKTTETAAVGGSK
ncbi:MAG: WD40/YVTN/BNR-like repeat-containing protein [Thermoanaerobaculia bacterium]